MLADLPWPTFLIVILTGIAVTWALMRIPGPLDAPTTPSDRRAAVGQAESSPQSGLSDQEIESLEAELAIEEDGIRETAKATLKVCLAVNGAASLATFAFLGSDHAKNLPFEALVDSLMYFFAGTLSAVLATVFANFRFFFGHYTTLSILGRRPYSTHAHWMARQSHFLVSLAFYWSLGFLVVGSLSVLIALRRFLEIPA